MSDKVMLIVSDEDDDSCGKVHVLDTAEEAERMIETLLQADCDRARIRVLTGAAVDFTSAYRPTVTIPSDTPAEPQHREPSPTGRLEPEADEVEAGVAEARADGGDAAGPRRPSSLFRSA